MSDQPAPVGAAYIKEFVATLSGAPGVYRMLDPDEKVLYVGKAKNLKNRVSNYAFKGAHSTRILRMISRTVRMEVITTRNEAEALLLEAQLIKQLKPIFNILLRDDKTYPYVKLSGDHPYPQIAKHRGKQDKPHQYFGPFANVSALNNALHLLQRAFLLRPCADTVFHGRSRPCLQYQIKRCSAPCVGYVTEEEYAALVAQAVQFLKGESRAVQDALQARMEAHSKAMEFELAGQCRDRIKALTQVQQEQRLLNTPFQDADVLALHCANGYCCIQVFLYRAGQPCGNRAYFPSNITDIEAPEIMATFIGQFYQNHPAPAEIYCNITPDQPDVLEDALHLLKEQKIRIIIPQRGAKYEAMQHVVRNAESALVQHVAGRLNDAKLLAEIAELFQLSATPQRIEVYDNSHISGTHAVGGMIVASAEGLLKNQYRRFSIRLNELTPGDDYAMMRQVFTRRFSRLLREDPDRTSGQWPDLVLIDGGAGQLSTVMDVMEACGITDVALVAISKGLQRNAGREQFHQPGKEAYRLEKDTPALHYLQRLRDEAHRYAISSHRIKRSNAIRISSLDDIAGIGTTRKRALLNHFGSAKSVEEATIDALMQVDGISRSVAEKIYGYFHEQ